MKKRRHEVENIWKFCCGHSNFKCFDLNFYMNHCCFAVALFFEYATGGNVFRFLCNVLSLKYYFDKTVMQMWNFLRNSSVFKFLHLEKSITNINNDVGYILNTVVMRFCELFFRDTFVFVKWRCFMKEKLCLRASPTSTSTVISINVLTLEMTLESSSWIIHVCFGFTRVGSSRI